MKSFAEINRVLFKAETFEIPLQVRRTGDSETGQVFHINVTPHPHGIDKRSVQIENDRPEIFNPDFHFPTALQTAFLCLNVLGTVFLRQKIELIMEALQLADVMEGKDAVEFVLDFDGFPFVLQLIHAFDVAENVPHQILLNLGIDFRIHDFAAYRGHFFVESGRDV